MKLSIFHTPEQTPTTLAADCAIAVDVLRATSTMVTALSVGAEAVQVFSDLDELLQASEHWAPDKRIRAGERGGAMVDGFDFGNSPLECTPDRVGGRRLFISTTNGTRALQQVQATPRVLAAALINRRAIVNYVLDLNPETLWIVCSGWEGSFSLEDTVCAGAIADALVQVLGCSLEDLAATDEVIGAVSLYRQWQERLLDLFYHASHGKRLLRLKCYEDLKYCSQLDILNVVPVQREPGVLVAERQPAIVR